MAKIPDYAVYGRKLNKEKTHIVGLCCYHIDGANQNGGYNLGKAVEFSRNDVVDMIKKGKGFITIYKHPVNQKLTNGETIIIDHVVTEYLKTISNNKTCDNLDNLPEVQ
jgi:hypothetical protein